MRRVGSKMRVGGWRRVVSGGIITLSVALIATFAVLYRGYPTADVELNDGGVWVTRHTEQLVGHLNYPSRLLDGATSYVAPNPPELLQHGNDIATYEPATGKLDQVEPAAVEYKPGTTLAPGSRVASRGGNVGIIDAGNEGLYVITTKEIAGFTATGRDPIAQLGKGSAVAAGIGGAVYAVSLKGELVTVAGAEGQPTTAQLGAFKQNASLQLSVVGDVPVVFDAANGTLYAGGKAIEVPEATNGKLQAAGPANDKVLIAAPGGLVVQPLDGGKATLEAVSGGDPAQPVWVGGCGYAVWSGSAAYVRVCANPADNVNQALPGAIGQPKLTLRQNRAVVVVNELIQGLVWLATNDLTQVNNWDDVTDRTKDGDEQSEEQKLSYRLPPRDPKNHPPVAEPDSYGVRVGSTAVLPVLDNDNDPDGDLLAASLKGKAPDGITVQPVSAGAALQVTVDPNYAGTSAKFDYEVNDGRRGTDQATVSLTIAAPGANSPPQQAQARLPIQLEVGASASYDALMGWTDPERDDLYLKGADSAKGDQVIYRSNGVIQFTEGTGEVGPHEVALTVSDGKDETKGTLRVDVRPKGTLVPIANADRYSTTTGDQITIAPIANDLSTSGKELRLGRIDEQVKGARTTIDHDANTFAFEADQEGTYYVQYLVLDEAGKAADGIVRVDVHAKDGPELAPLATRDVALVPPSHEALVDVLANDSDPSGGILVVQSVTVPAGVPVSAEILEHRVLRITDAGLDGPATIGYSVCGGERCASAEVRVVPVGQSDKAAVPVAQSDTAVVRAGDIVTVDVTANDYHPAGDSIELLPGLREVPDAASGTAFVSEGKVRFRAADAKEEREVAVVYEISDTRKHVTAGRLRIQVLPADPDRNRSPKPVSVAARTLAGTSVRIPIPLGGIDPDGDSVELVGLAAPEKGRSSAPQKGRVTVGDSWLTYQAYAKSSGSDSFGYQVRDQLGGLATGTVVVGIAPQSSQNQAPYAVRDEVRVRPGRSVSVPVLTNDSDPDGDQVALVANGLKVPSGVVASVVKSRVLVEAPRTPGDYTIGYTATDEFGARALGTVVVTVDEQAPLQPPLARDDRVQPAQLTGAATVDVPVTDNDEDPDGVADKLVLTTDSPNAVPGAPGTLKVTLTPKPQLILYTVTDVDRQSASAVVFVPGTDALLPTLKSTTPLDVVGGKDLSISLAEVVRVRAGRTPRVAVADLVTYRASGAKVLNSTIVYSAAADYYGPDAIGVQVTDGEGPDDPKGHKAFLSIPIRVLPATNEPPTLKESTVAVVPGEKAIEVRLNKLASDPNPEDAGQLRFAVVAPPAGITASIDGDRLLVAADGAAKPGTTAELGVEVADSRGEKSVGRVNVLITRSQRGLPVAVDDAVDRAEQGRTVSVDVLRNDVNPFDEDGKPLTVISAKVVGGKGTAAVSGNKLDVTPDPDFVGTMEISYRIQDAVERTAEGTLRVTVQGAPDQVGRPLVETVGNKMVVLRWSPPDNNGRPITSYTVTSKTEGFSQKCATTTCTLTGLTNNKEYTFQVVATNEIGDSEPSAPSAVARPDVRPDTPAAPTLEFGDKQLIATWKTPHTDGSAVSSYNLQISPPPDQGNLQRSVSGNRVVWTGLRNGTAYQVRVQALNQAPEPSGWSQWSRSEIPAGKPDAPGQPTTQPADPVGNQSQIKVAWPAVTGAAANGDAVKNYTLKVSDGRTINAGTSTTQNVRVEADGNYIFVVTATNKAGESGGSPRSAPRRGAVPPGAPTNVKAEPGDRKVALSFTPGSRGGSSAGEITYHYRNNRTGSTGTLPSGGGTVSGLDNGTSYTFDVWATSSVDGVDPGPKATSDSAVPFGPPIISNARQTSATENSVTFAWTVDSNGADITSCDGQPDGCGTGSRSWTKTGLSAGQSWSDSWTYRNKGGSDVLRLSGRTNDPPRPRYWLDRSGDTVRYHYSNFRGSDFAEVSTMRCWRYTRDGHPGGFATDGAGQTSFSRPAEGSSGSFAIDCGSGVTDGYSVEPWRYGPWLNMNESVTR